MVNNLTRWRPTAAALVLVGLAAAGGGCHEPARHPGAYQGVIELDERPLAFEVGGRLTELAVRRGARVEPGAMLAALDDTLARTSTAGRQAEAQVATARARLVRAGSRTEDVRALEAQLRAAQANEELIVRNLTRDRALVAFFCSSGARASELLGACCGDVDPGAQLITVVRKGSRALQQLPASPDAFVWLRLYQAEMEGLVSTAAVDPLFWTRRRPFRRLNYHAARAMFARANAALGANWTLHDLRHTAAYRMAQDPEMPLVDVQWVLGHAHLQTTQVYLRPSADDVIAAVRAHHGRRDDTAPPPGSSEYRAESLAVLFNRAPR